MQFYKTSKKLHRKMYIALAINVHKKFINLLVMALNFDVQLENDSLICRFNLECRWLR
jgi:hypothetical protein